jgi:drug/metabolite transporter (DMT)-like permease
VSRTIKAHILLILVTLVWGATFVVIKDALRDISPLLFNTVRMTLAAVTLGLIYMGPLRRMNWDAFKAGALVGTFLWLGYEFQTTGLKLTTPSKSAFLTGVSVVLVPLFLALFWRKKLRPWTWAGVAMAFVGLYLLTVPNGEAGASFNLTGVNLGDVLTLGCAIGFALQIIFMGKATQVYRFEQLATIQAATAAVLMAVTFPMVEHVYVVWSARVIWAIAITGLLGTAAAFTIQAWAQQFTSPTYTALIFALEPVFAWLTSYLVLRERLGYRGGVGAMLILIGIVVAELLGGADAEPSVGAPARA